MIRSRLSYVRLHLRLLTLLLPVCSYFIAVKIRFGYNLLTYHATIPGLPSYWSIVLLTTIVWAIAAEESGMWSVEQLYAPFGKSRKLLESIIFTYGVVMAAGFLYRQASYSRLVIGISAIALFFLASVARVAFRVLLEMLRRNGATEIKILLIGTDRFAQRVALSLTHGEVLPCKVMGFVRLPGQEVAVEGPVYEEDQIPHFANEDSINDVVIALPADRQKDVRRVSRSLEQLCVPVRLVMDLGEQVGLRDRLIDVGGIHMLDIRPTLAESDPYLVQKRIFDVVFSIVVLLFTAPLIALIALAIKVTSRGPVFFIQERVGLNGRTFKMAKFRTMRVGTRQECDTRWTCAEDQRRTILGVFLRKTNLDELPQFFNVLRGDMSIVGPRPERPHFVNKFLSEFDRYNFRHTFKVGITGWAQVNGWRGDTSIAKRVEYDLYYLRNWSITFDLQIIAITLVNIFNSKNAY
ncbi:MAG: undecaprenyl-phosphate glucose phosphotransferase [Terriglobales bacterium]